MSARRPRHAQQTREALLVAAEAAFASQGFGGARTEAIARAAGVNKAMIQYHFGGKAGLYSAVLTRCLKPALEGLEALAQRPDDALTRLDAFLRIFGEFQLRHPRFAVMVLREMLNEGRQLDRDALPRFVRVFAVLAEILEQGRRDGTLREVPGFSAHLSIFGGLAFFFASRGFRARVAAEGKAPFADVPPESFVEFYRELMLHALAEPPLSTVRSNSQSTAKRRKS